MRSEWPTLPAFGRRVGILTSFPEKSNPPDPRKSRGVEHPAWRLFEARAGCGKSPLFCPSGRSEESLFGPGARKEGEIPRSARNDKVFFLAFCAACTVRTYGMSCLMPGILAFSLAPESGGFRRGPHAEFVAGEIARRGAQKAFRPRRR
jgi:hypothetical protein